MKFLDYIKGSREGKEANALEKEAMSDPFLADAMDGYDDFPDINPEQGIDKIREHIGERRILSRKSRLGTISVAAMIFLLIGGGYFFMKNSADFSMLYETDRYVAADKKNIEPDESENLSMLAPSRSNNDTEYIQSDTENIRTIEDRVSNVFGQNAAVSNDLSQDSDGVNEVHETVKDVTDNSESKQDLGSVALAIDQDRQVVSKIELNKESDKESIDLSRSVNSTSYSHSQPKSVNENKSIDRDIKRQKLDNKNIRLNAVDLTTPTPAKPTKDLAKVVASPEPIIGYTKYKQYLKSNLKRPDSQACDSIKGVVILEFSVSDSGRPTNVKIAKSLCSALDNEAIRLLNSGSDWTISKQKGKLKVQF